MADNIADLSSATPRVGCPPLSCRTCARPTDAAPWLLGVTSDYPIRLRPKDRVPTYMGGTPCRSLKPGIPVPNAPPGCWRGQARLSGAGAPRLRRRLHRRSASRVLDRHWSRCVRGRGYGNRRTARLCADDLGDRRSRESARSAQSADGRIRPHGCHRSGICLREHLCSRPPGRAGGHDQPLVRQRQRLRSAGARGLVPLRWRTPSARACLRATA